MGDGDDISIRGKAALIPTLFIRKEPFFKVTCYSRSDYVVVNYSERNEGLEWLVKKCGV